MAALRVTGLFTHRTHYTAPSLSTARTHRTTAPPLVYHTACTHPTTAPHTSHHWTAPITSLHHHHHRSVTVARSRHREALLFVAQPASAHASAEALDTLVFILRSLSLAAAARTSLSWCRIGRFGPLAFHPILAKNGHDGHESLRNDANFSHCQRIWWVHGLTCMRQSQQKSSSTALSWVWLVWKCASVCTPPIMTPIQCPFVDLAQLLSWSTNL